MVCCLIQDLSKYMYVCKYTDYAVGSTSIIPRSAFKFNGDLLRQLIKIEVEMQTFFFLNNIFEFACCMCSRIIINLILNLLYFSTYDLKSFLLNSYRLFITIFLPFFTMPCSRTSVQTEIILCSYYNWLWKYYLFFFFFCILLNRKWAMINGKRYR